MKFNLLNIDKRILENLDKLNYESLTLIQEKTIPIFLENKDILAIAKTGSGKTATFLIPIINKILQSNLENKKQICENENNNKKLKTPISLILAPSRELCIQIGKHLGEISKNLNIEFEVLHGGEDFEKQKLKLENSNKNIDILISTPTRICDLVKEKLIFLDEIKFFIIDEVDKILEENFNSNLRYLNKKLSRKKQSAFFSATISPAIEEISDLILKNPKKINLIENEGDLFIKNNKIIQKVLFVQKEFKYKLLLQFLKKDDISQAIIFTNSRKSCDELLRFLKNNDIFTETIHSAKSNVHREKVVNNFINKKTKFLITTDLLSRGIDFKEVSHIFNFEIPTSTQIYTHRIGRSARAGKTGIAINFCSSTERNFIRTFESELNLRMKILKHDFHSEYAQKAEGDKSKPKFNSKQNNFGKYKKKPKFEPRVLKNSNMKIRK